MTQANDAGNEDVREGDVIGVDEVEAVLGSSQIGGKCSQRCIL